MGDSAFPRQPIIILVQYYFDYACKLFSSFDSALNPFRSIIGRLWSRNAAIYFAIQSMAAASLANDFPSMRAVGIQMQKQAFACLQEEIQAKSSQVDDNDETFFALLMIGSTTAWHNGGDLGVGHLKAARDHIAGQQQRCQGQDSVLAKQYPFFKQCLLYWKMLVAFVAEDAPLSIDVENTAGPEPDLPLYFVNGQLLSHPWTGSLSKVLGVFYRTARLIRATRTSHSTWISLRLISPSRQ